MEHGCVQSYADLLGVSAGHLSNAMCEKHHALRAQWLFFVAPPAYTSCIDSVLTP